MADEDDVWFEAKRFGYGAGRPVAWQGWMLLGGYFALLTGLGLALRHSHPFPYFAVVVAATIALIVVCARHTRGGWRWRP